MIFEKSKRENEIDLFGILYRINRYEILGRTYLVRSRARHESRYELTNGPFTFRSAKCGAIRTEFNRQTLHRRDRPGSLYPRQRNAPPRGETRTERNTAQGSTWARVHAKLLRYTTAPRGNVSTKMDVYHCY